MTTRRMPSANRREQLLDAAATLVDTDGFPAVTIERVATSCGVSRTVVYQLFGGLDGLLDDLVQRASRRALDALTAASTTPANPMTAILDAVDVDPATWRMFLVAPRVGPPALADNLAAGRAAIRSHNIAAVDEAGVDDPELAAHLLQAVADELVRLRLADPGVYSTERLTAAYESVSRGLTTRVAPRCQTSDVRLPPNDDVGERHEREI